VDAPRPGGDSPPVVEQEVSESDSGSSEASEQASEAPTQESRPPGYSACEVVSPGHGENFQGVQAITVALSVQPELQRGHRIQLFVNGAAQPDWPAQALTFTLPEVVRGSHTLSVRILDARGRTVCTGPPITFQLRQQSVIRPAQSGA
jgi:hypothetical protein